MNLIVICSTIKSDAYDYVSRIGIPVPNRIMYTDPNLVSELLKSKGVKKTVIKLLTGNSGKGVFYGKTRTYSKPCHRTDRKI